MLFVLAGSEGAAHRLSYRGFLVAWMDVGAVLKRSRGKTFFWAQDRQGFDGLGLFVRGYGWIGGKRLSVGEIFGLPLFSLSCCGARNRKAAALVEVGAVRSLAGRPPHLLYAVHALRSTVCCSCGS